MTKFALRMPSLDAAAQRKAPPVLTYSVEQLPSFDAALYNGARADLSKVAEVTVPPHERGAPRERAKITVLARRQGKI